MFFNFHTLDNMKSLTVKAGPTAKKILLERGFQSEDVRIIPAAASGPKSLVMYELDKYLFGSWLKDAKQTIHLIGASAGAWRMACAAQNNPITALDKLHKYYIEQTYPDFPTPQEVSEKSAVIIRQLLGTSGVTEIMENSRRILHVITNRATFDTSPKYLKMKLITLALKDMFSNSALSQYFERNIFSSHPHSILNTEVDVRKTKSFPLTKNNLLAALRGSGAIPTIISPIKGITGTQDEHFDGGITDYHLDLPWNLDSGLVIYPHHHHKIIPTWLDKFPPKRKAHAKWLDRLVLLHPSKEFIAALPNQRIPSRKDFKQYFKKDNQRIEVWRMASEQCRQLALEFHEYVENGIPEKHILAF